MNIRFISEIPSALSKDDTYEHIDKVFYLSEKFNFDASLIYYFNDTLDPWTLATKLINDTNKLTPLLAVQPYYLSPYAISKIVKSIAALYNRRISLNFVTGMNNADMASVGLYNDPKEKYRRLKEYIEVYSHLLTNSESVDYHGEFYKYTNIYSGAPLRIDMVPEIFIPGSSYESISLSKAVADTTLLRPQPISLFKDFYSKYFMKEKKQLAIRISIIARSSSEKAWEVAEKRYRPNRQGKINTILRSSSASNNTQLMANLALEQVRHDDVYWMGAYLSGKTEDPYLVGSYDEIVSYLKQYIKLGVNTFLIGNTNEFEEEVEHIAQVMDLVKKRVLVDLN